LRYIEITDFTERACRGVSERPEFVVGQRDGARRAEPVAREFLEIA
jgi:hypothetical protein